MTAATLILPHQLFVDHPCIKKAGLFISLKNACFLSNTNFISRNWYCTWPA